MPTHVIKIFKFLYWLQVQRLVCVCVEWTEMEGNEYFVPEKKRKKT